MTEEAFVNFAKRRISVGAKADEIAAALKVNGLSEEEIKDVLRAAGALPPEPAPVSPWTAPLEEGHQTPHQTMPASPASRANPPPPPERTAISRREEVSVVLPSRRAERMPQKRKVKGIDAPAGFAYASFFVRMMAGILDLGVLLVLSIVAMISYLIATASLSPMTLSETRFLLEVAGGICVLLYHPIFECTSWRGSLGKHFLGISVADDRGQCVGFGRAFVRNLLAVPSSIFVLGFLMIAFTARKQALHDLLTKTLVLRPLSTHR